MKSIVSIHRLRLLLCLTLAAVFTFACDVAPPTPKSNEPKDAAVEQTDDLDKNKVAAFTKLEHAAIDAFNADQLLRCNQLVAKGIRQTQQAGRKYDLHEARFSILQGKIVHKQGRATTARRHFADAMAIFRIRKNAPGTFEVHLAQASLEEGTGDFAAAQREINEAEKLLPKIDNQKLKGSFILQQASLLASQMKHSDAAKLFLEAAKLFHTINDKTLEADAYVQLSSSEESMDMPRQSKNSLQKAHKIYMAAQNKEGAVKALHKLALISLQEKKYKTAKEQLKRVEALYLELDKQSDATKVNQHLSALPE